MSKTGKLLLIVVCCHSHVIYAQEIRSVEDMLPVDRLHEDFYGAIGDPAKPIQVTWQCQRTEVELGSVVSLQLIVSNSLNPSEVKPPNLRENVAFQEIFDQIDKPTQAIHDNAVSFEFQMRPRNIGEYELPLPKYRVYYPQYPEGRRFPTAFTDPIRIQVNAKVVQEASEIITPLVADEVFLRIPGNSAILTEQQQTAASWLQDALVILPAFVVVAIFMIWFRIFPDSARLKKLRRTYAGRIAVRELFTKDFLSDSTAVAPATIFRYLQDCGIVSRRINAAEEFAQVEFTEECKKPVAKATLAFLRQCEAIRFGVAQEDSRTIRETALILLEQWEAIRA